jgi:hypothetical protein
MDPSVVAAAHARCLGVHPWTVNQSADMTTLVAAGVDGMFTNVPDELDAVLGPAALRAKKAARRAAKNRTTCLRVPAAS